MKTYAITSSDMSRDNLYSFVIHAIYDARRMY